MDELDAEDRAARRATRLVAASSMGALLALSAALAHSSGSSTVNADTGSTGAGSTTDPSTSTTAVSTTTTGPAPTTTACTTTYTVQSGDSWYLLAQEASLSADALLTANGASASTALHPDQTICLPDGAVVVTTTTPPVTAASPAPASAPTATTAATVRATVPAPSHTTATSG